MKLRSRLLALPLVAASVLFPSVVLFAQASATEAAAPSSAAATIPGPVFLSPARIALLRDRIAAHTEPTYTAYLEVKKAADAAKDRQASVPAAWYVPPFYVDPEGHKKAKGTLAGDANAAYALALVYRMTDDPAYAAAAVRLIDAWAQLSTFSQKDDSTLTFCYHFPPLLYAAALVRPWDGWPEEKRQAFDAFVRKKALPMNTMSKQNNWGNWGLVLSAACGAYLNDQALIDKCAARWKAFIAIQINPDGALSMEVTRNGGVGEHGIWYSHFALMAQTFAAEILLQRGIDLYDYVSPDGKTMKTAYLKLVPWAADPSTFPYYKGTDPKGQMNTDSIGYWEVLDSRWPTPQAEQMIASRRPLNPLQGAPFITFTHGGIAP